MSIFLWPFAFLFLILPFAVRFFLPPQENQGSVQALRVPFFERVKSFTTVGQTIVVHQERKWLVLAWVLFVLAAMRPVWYDKQVPLPQEARNIVLDIDVSGSMQETDFDLNGKPVSRLSMVKAVVDDFLKKREQDNVGLVLFGSEAYTYVPLSFDKKTAQALLKEVAVGMAGEMTAIGDGLAMGVQNAIKVPAQSRVIVLLSDGYANAGVVSVSEALSLAKKNNVKVYTIGVGSDIKEVDSFFGTSLINPAADLDEKTLSEIANQTGGQYFRAKSTDDLKQIYSIIDKLEKSPQKELTVRPQKELFYLPLIGGLFFLALAWLNRRRK